MEFSAGLFERRITKVLIPWAKETVDESGKVAGSSSQAVLDVSDLCSIGDDRRFLEEAYRRILGRGCDLVSLANCLEMLNEHVPRRVILLQLVNSDEARRRGLRFTGVQQVAEPPRVKRSILSPFQRIKQRLSAQLFDVARRIVFARFDAINHKLNFLLRAVEARTDDLSAMTDRGLVAVSEKLDANFALLNVRANEVSARLEQVLSNSSQQLSPLDERLAMLATGIESIEGRLVRELSDVRSALAYERSQLAALEQRHQETLKRLDALDQSAVERDRIGSEELAAVSRKSPSVLGGNNVLATEVDGFIVGVPGEEWRLAAHHAFRGVLEPGLVKHFRGLVKPGMVVVDVGANIGIYTLHAARILGGQGRVHSFEPTPRTSQILKDNIQVNGYLETNVVVIHETAVSDRAGQAQLAMFPEDSGHNTLFGDPAHTNRIPVQTVRLDQVLEEEQHIDVVKIDAEGAEPLILRGMKNIIARNPDIRILMEFAPSHLRRAGFRPEDFLKEIESLGFRVLRVHDETGELVEVTCEQLKTAFSANLDLARAPSSMEDSV